VVRRFGNFPEFATNADLRVFDEEMSKLSRFAVATTPQGAIGVVWSDAGIVATWMHAPTVERSRAHLRGGYPAAIEAVPPAAVVHAMNEVAGLLGGQRLDLRDVALDMSAVPDFDRRVYELARTIPPGTTMTYGEVAKALGEEPMRARDVGVALSRNPFAPIVPCHRVVAAGGKLGGYSAPGGTSTKRRLLEIEGASIVAPPPQQGLFDSISS
jgi:methylated-DNA-[protein]-cysteine S-methyltransferase